MPRNYKPDPRGKQYSKYDDATIQQALEEYNTTPKCSISDIAKKYNINKSVLYRHNRKTMKKQGGQNALDIDTERHIVQYLNVCSDWGYPLDRYDLRIIVKLYLDNMGVTNRRFKNNMPGPDYATNFLKRYKDSISLRICQNIKKSRAEVSPCIIEEYFEELEKTLKEIDPNNIINYDETNLSDDPGRKKVIVKRGTKYPERVLNQSKSSISIMMAGTAAGELLPPYVIYKANNIYDTWTTGGPKGTRYNRTLSGWIDGNTFEDYVKSIIIPFFHEKPGKKLLIGDNLSSHLSIEVIRICQENNISFVFLPANSTHLTQPLDIAFFRPMKIAWRNILLKWKKTDGRTHATVPKGCFPKLLKQLINNLAESVESNLKAGFCKAGVFPIDRDQVLSRLPKDNTVDPNKSRYAVDKSVLDILKEMRYGTINIKEPSHKRKLNVEYGKSFENIDDENLETESDNKTTNKQTKIYKKDNKKKKVNVVPGKAVDLNSKSNNTDNKELENTDPKNYIKRKPKEKTDRVCKSKKNEEISLIKNFKNDLLNKDRKNKIKTSKIEEEKIDINLLPVVCVDECAIVGYPETNMQNINNSSNGSNFKVNDEKIKSNEWNSHKNMLVNYWDSGPQQDEELFISNYIDEDAMTSPNLIPDIDPDIFSEITDPALVAKENENAKDKKVSIISIEKMEPKQVMTVHKCKRISINTQVGIGIKNKVRRNYYKNDADILKELTNE